MPYSSLPSGVIRPYEEMLERDRSVRAVEEAVELIVAAVSEERLKA